MLPKQQTKNEELNQKETKPTENNWLLKTEGNQSEGNKRTHENNQQPNIEGANG